jgi:hypothetical protein
MLVISPATSNMELFSRQKHSTTHMRHNKSHQQNIFFFSANQLMQSKANLPKSPFKKGDLLFTPLCKGGPGGICLADLFSGVPKTTLDLNRPTVVYGYAQNIS